VKAPWPGVPNPNAAGVAPFCPCPPAPKSNGDPVPFPIDVEGVTGVNTNVGGLGPVVPSVPVEEVVAAEEVLEAPKENVGLFIAGAGVGGVAVVPNALTGVGVVPNRFPLVVWFTPGLKVSCLGAGNEKVLGEVPVVAEVVKFGDGKVTFESDPPAGLLILKPNKG